MDFTVGDSVFLHQSPGKFRSTVVVSQFS